MFVHLTDSTIVEVLHESKTLPYQPRWGVSGRSLKVGSYHNGDEHEHHIVAETIGSGLWYGPEDSNEFRFDENDLTLKSIWFPVPEENMDLGNLVDLWTRQEPLVGALRLTSSEGSEGFSPEFADFRWFDPQGRMLVCITKNALLETESRTRLRIATDVELMFTDNHLCGWILFQPLKYAVYGWEDPHPLEFAEDSTLTMATQEYLQIASKPFIDQLLDEDPEVLKALQNINQKLDKGITTGYQRKVLSESIERLIENFYGEVAA
jgi:hypothetical protein